jgi:hypothetical protein
VTDHQATTDELLRALAALGFEAADRVRLRFSFEADTPSEAVDLARELRARNGNRVHLGPKPVEATGKRRWGIALKTPPTPLEEQTIRKLEAEMEAVARNWPGRYLGWRPMLEPTQVKRRTG